MKNTTSRINIINKSLSYLFLAFLVLLNGCSYVIKQSHPLPSETPFPVYTDTLVPTLSYTPSPSSTPSPTPTDTPTPTVTSTSTDTPTPTITPTPTPAEWDLDPYISMDIEGEWKGVYIKTAILVDCSLEDQIENVSVIDEYILESVARVIWVVWMDRNGYTNYLNYSDPDPSKIDYFMSLWARAQRTGNEWDWRQVQLNTVWANDLDDGEGNVEKPYSFWPMYNGDRLPSDVIGFERMTFVYLGKGHKTNLTSKVPYTGWGANIGGQTLYIYWSSDYGP